MHCCSVEGEGGTGYVTVEDFLQVLTSPDLGLQLEENEQTYVVSQVLHACYQPTGPTHLPLNCVFDMHWPSVYTHL